MSLEIRYANEELRYDADTGTIEGIVMRYGDTARIFTTTGTFVETISPGAFGDISDVTLNLQHKRDRVFARTGGGGMELEDTDKALFMRTIIPDTSEGRDARKYLENGVLRGLSVEMDLNNGNGEDKLSRKNGVNTRLITRAKLNGIGVVARPAYGDSQAVLKRFESLEDEQIELKLDTPPEETRAFEAEYYFDEVETISDTGSVRKRQFSPGSFDASIRDPDQEITLSIGRNPNEAIGSKRAGTLLLETVDGKLEARVDNPAETTAFRDLQAKVQAGAAIYMEPLFRELDGEYTDIDEPGNPGVKIRQYNSVKLYGLGLSVRGKKGQRATGDPPVENGETRWLTECLAVFATE